jgi:radical SAM superfamily enzyme YgiQ (UPF0313 family)
MLGARTLVPPLGLITMAAMLPEEWDLRLVDLAARRLTPEDWDWAEMVMITGMIVQKDDLLALAHEARRRNKTVVVGGPYVTSVHHEVLDAGVDFVVRGEAENTLPLFLEALSGGKTRGVFELDERPEVTTSPIPRFDLLRPSDYAVMGLQTSRGCPFDCEFCDIVNLYGRKPRYKSPVQVIAELATLLHLGWRGLIFISDDNFVGNTDQARALLRVLVPWMKSHGEPFSFWGQASLNLGRDQETMDLMTAANFSHIFVGIESPSEDVLALNQKYQNIRNPLAESIQSIRRNGLSVVASFIIGFDNEEKGAGERISEFVEENALPLVMLNTLQVLPNTRLWNRLKSERRLLQDRTGGNTTGGQLNYLPTRPESEIMEEYVQAWRRLYEPSAYLERAYRYVLDMRPTRLALGLEEKPSNGSRRTDGHRPLRRTSRDLLALLKHIWRHGIVSSYKMQFWRQLVGVYRRNPSRIRNYLIACIAGENLFQLVDAVRTRAALLERQSTRKLESP